MGPQRQNWTFPYRGEFLIGHLQTQEAALVEEINMALDDEALYERDLAEFREKMRKAGVSGWDRMQLADEKDKYRGTRARDHYQKAAKKLLEIQRYRRALEHDVERDPTRTFKLTFDDLVFLGL